MTIALNIMWWLALVLALYGAWILAQGGGRSAIVCLMFAVVLLLLYVGLKP